MEIDKWIGSCKIRSFPWIDGKRIYFNAQLYKHGQSVCQHPIWDKTVYIADDTAGRRLVYEFTDSLVQYICGMQIPDGAEVILTVG